MKHCFILLSILAIFLTVPTWAKDNIVLLTSLNAKNPSWMVWRRIKDVEQELVQKFNKAFPGTDYNVITVTQANQFELWQHLQSADTKAIFWVSHALSGGEAGAGLNSDNIISDSELFNVSPLFRQLHPNIRFLGLVGCYSQKIYESYVAEGDYVHSPDLHVQSYSEKVSLRKGFKEAIKKSKEVLASASNEKFLTTPEETNATITIIRKIPPTTLKAVPVRIVLDDRILEIFPAMSAGESKTLEIKINRNEVKKLNLKFDTGAIPGRAEDFVIGDFEIKSTDLSYEWKLFKNNQTGKPYGFGHNIYVAKKI